MYDSEIDYRGLGKWIGTGTLSRSFHNIPSPSLNPPQPHTLSFSLPSLLLLLFLLLSSQNNPNSSLLSLDLDLSRSGMAAEEEGFSDQLRRATAAAIGGGGGAGVSFVPLIVGMVGPAAGGRIVLVNPLTQGMVVVQGDAGMISAILAGAGAGAGRDGPPPASRASIAALKTVVDLKGPDPSSTAEEEEEEEEEEECAICLDGLETEGEGVAAKEMPCGHRFHGGCIEKWLGMHGSCPVCRYRMPAEEGEAKKSGEGGEGEPREVWLTIAVGRRVETDEQEEEVGGDGDD